MFGWFRKKAPKLSPRIKTAEKLLGPVALAVAIVECVSEHAAAVKAGKVDFPAHRRKGSNVKAIWIDLRLEAMRPMFGFGQADLMMLSNMTRQAELLAAFVDERPHLEFPQPRGQPVADTWQGVWQVYRYLDAVGSEVMDRETNRAALKARRCNIISAFTAEATQLRDRWAAFENAVKTGSGPRPEMPPTVIEVFWADVTAKTKSIALSTIFGPHYEGGIAYRLKLVEEQATDAQVAKLRATIGRILAAKMPEDIREARKSRK